MRNRVGLLRCAGLLAGALAVGAAAAAGLTECRVEGIPNSVQCGMLDRPLDPARTQGPQDAIGTGPEQEPLRRGSGVVPKPPEQAAGAGQLRGGGRHALTGTHHTNSTGAR